MDVQIRWNHDEQDTVVSMTEEEAFALSEMIREDGRKFVEVDAPDGFFLINLDSIQWVRFEKRPASG